MDPGAQNSSAVVQITLGQVYSEVTGMRADVRDLASTMKTAVGQLGDHETRLRAVERDYVTEADLEKVRHAAAEALEKAARTTADELGAAAGRISSLERFRWTVTPLASVLSAAGAAALTKLVSGH